MSPPAENPAAAALLAPWSVVLASRGGEAAVLAADGAVTRRFREIEYETLELGGRFADLPARSIVAVQIGNSPNWPAVFLALLRAGHGCRYHA